MQSSPRILWRGLCVILLDAPDPTRKPHAYWNRKDSRSMSVTFCMYWWVCTVSMGTWPWSRWCGMQWCVWLRRPTSWDGSKACSRCSLPLPNHQKNSLLRWNPSMILKIYACIDWICYTFWMLFPFFYDLCNCQIFDLSNFIDLLVLVFFIYFVYRWSDIFRKTETISNTNKVYWPPF